MIASSTNQNPPSVSASSKPELEAYLRTPEQEWLLIDWFFRLVKTGDISKTFTANQARLSEFLAFFNARAIMGYAKDAQGIWFAVWLEPCMSGAFCGVWIREDKRHVPSALRLLSDAYNRAFQVFPVLIGISKQAHLREIHRKLGYSRLIQESDAQRAIERGSVSPAIPALWDGEAVDVYVLTKESWMNRKENK